MTLPPFEEFMKSVAPIIQDNQDDTNMTESQKLANVLAKEVSRITFNHIECYHNWLTEQLDK